MKLPSHSIADPSWRARLLLATTRLRVLFGLGSIKRALAQDALIAEITPMLRTPDLIVYEEELLAEWAETRPEAAAIASSSAAKLEGALKKTNIPGDAIAFRLKLHLAAHRRLDAAVMGDEVFTPCQWFMGEPHLEAPLSDGSVMKIGIVRIADYYGSNADSERSIERLAQSHLVEEVERMLFPLLPASRDVDAYAKEFAHWSEMAPLREFELSQKYPLFPRSLPLPFSGATPPPGYIKRFNAKELSEVNADLTTVSMAGFSPYMAIVFADYCRNHTTRLEDLEKEVDRLAIDHLVRHLRDIKIEGV